MPPTVNSGELMDGFIYLATPYSEYPYGISIAYHDALMATGEFISAGISAYSPIVHMHAIATRCRGVPAATDSEKWVAINKPMMQVASACVVVMMEWWEKSSRIAREIRYFEGAGKPVAYLPWPVTAEGIADVMHTLSQSCGS